MEPEKLSDQELIQGILQALETRNSAAFCQLYPALGARKGPDWDAWAVSGELEPEDMWYCFSHLFEAYDYCGGWLRWLSISQILTALKSADGSREVLAEELCRRLGPEALPYLEREEDEALLSMPEQQPHESGLMFNCLYVCPEEALCIRFYPEPAGISGKDGCKAVLCRGKDPETVLWDLRHATRWDGGYTYPSFAWYEGDVLYRTENGRVVLEQVLPLKEYDQHIFYSGEILPEGSLMLDDPRGLLRLAPYYRI